MIRLSSTRSFVILALGASLAIGCAKKTDQVATDSTLADVPIHATAVMIVPADSSPDFNNAKLVIIAPREGQVLPKANDSVFVVLNVTGMDLAKPTDSDSTRGIAYSKQGSHVHVIVDEKPYMGDYKNGQPLNVGVLASGKHTIRAFPSRSYHESVKAPGAFSSRTFYVGSGPAKGVKDTTGPNLKGPMLTYSRPKGTYSVADAKKLLLDFYVTGAKLGPDDYKIAVSIDGKDMGTLTNWTPYYIMGLDPGKHTISLKLLDPKGDVVPGAFNSPSSEITIQ